MSLKNLKVAVGQMTSVDRVGENLQFILSAIKTASGQGADLVVFPENSLYLRLSNNENVWHLETGGAEAGQIAEAALAGSINVMLTTPTAGSGGKSRNATFLFRPGQKPEIVYSKIHMFDVDVDGAPPVRESDRFVSGEGPSIVEINGWKLGLSICYDLRFPELYSHYTDKVDAILVPAAFLVPTGKAHWHVLLRARAIENQCYVIAPAQCGEHKSSTGVLRHTFGHSLVVEPWGGVDLDNDQGPGVNTVELKAEKLAWVRKQIPMRHHRRMLRSEHHKES
jgi:predicted amidohydrolase